MSGHAQLKFVMTACSKTQIRLTGLIFSRENSLCMTEKLFEPPLYKTNKMTCVPSEDASEQSDQSLRCPHEETLGPERPNECIAKTLIRLGGCPG